MFSYGSSSSMSRAMVTPSLVIVGAPNFLSSRAYRPLGPSVTLTASAILSTPRFSERRASSSNSSCFATVLSLPPRFSGRAERGGMGCSSLLDDGQDVAVLQDQKLVVIELELGAGVLLEEDLLADCDLDLLARPVVQGATRADGQDGALLRALLGGVRQDDAALGHLLAGGRLDDHIAAQGLELGRRAADRAGHVCVMPPCVRNRCRLVRLSSPPAGVPGRPMRPGDWHSTVESAKPQGSTRQARMSRRSGHDDAPARGRGIGGVGKGRDQARWVIISALGTGSTPPPSPPSVV